MRLEALTNAKRLPSDLIVGELRTDLTCSCLPPAVLTTYNTVVHIVAAYLCRESRRNTSLVLSKGFILERAVLLDTYFLGSDRSERCTAYCPDLDISS